jgi:hypothetical protein
LLETAINNRSGKLGTTKFRILINKNYFRLSVGVCPESGAGFWINKPEAVMFGMANLGSQERRNK